MRVFIPTPLRSYTAGKGEIELTSSTLRELLSEMNVHYPGIRFRIIDEQDGIRQHIKLFVNAEQAHELDVKLSPRDQIHIICALSGGLDADSAG